MAELPSDDELLSESPAPAGSAEYEAWLARQPAREGDYLFADACVRFEARDDDALAAAPGLRVEAADGATRLSAPGLGRALEIGSLDPGRAERFVRALEARPPLAAAVRDAGLTPGERERLLASAFGVVVFAPLAVAELETSLPSAELVRFPGSPYELVRNYWANMLDVRSELDRLTSALADPVAAFHELSRLHGLALMGKSGGSYYRPASPISKKGVSPGGLLRSAVVLEERASGTRFVSGPRVNAALLGGEHYAMLLAEQTGDPEATAGARTHSDDGGLAWGRIVSARADGDAATAPWFCPPRPLQRAHARSLFESLAAANAATKPDQSVAALADFHQKFVRLHPFRAANQALAMNVVNAVLTRARGAGLPHLLLDHLALRFSGPAYRRLFARAVDTWSVTGSPLERHRQFASRKAAFFALVERLKSATDPDQARVIARGAPTDARLALLEPVT